MLGVWGENPRNLHSWIKICDVGNFGSVMLHHFEDFGKRGNLLTVLMFDIFLSKLLECICGLMLGFDKNIHVADAKWDNDN